MSNTATLCSAVGINREIEATAASSSDDARHLAWLRDSITDRFLAVFVVHTGPGSNSYIHKMVMLTQRFAMA